MTIEYLTAILVFITAIYAYLTHRMAKASEASVDAMRTQTEAMLRPYITVSPFVRPHTPFLYLRISNTGKTAAENVRLTVDRDFFQFGEVKRPEKNLRKLGVFSSPIDSIPPGTEFIFGLGQGWVIFGEDADRNLTPTQFAITAAYEFSGKHVTEVSRVDLRPYAGAEGERDPIVEELERIRKVMERRE